LQQLRIGEVFHGLRSVCARSPAMGQLHIADCRNHRFADGAWRNKGF
jgi:hypothetical protein